MQLKKPLAFLLLLLSFAAAAFGAADVNFPYAGLSLSLPPSVDPLPGFGTYYSAMACGSGSALWNPASLGKLKLSEAVAAVSTDGGIFNNQKSFKIDETSGTFNISSGSTGGGQYGLFFRAPAQIGSGIQTKEAEYLGKANYSTSTTGVNFSSAVRVNDWLAVGISATNPIAGSLTLAGEFPVTARADTNLFGVTIGQMEIEQSGKLKYTFENGGTVVTYESSAEVWSGFLSQEVTIPLLSFSELRDNLNIQAPYVGTIAANYNKFSFGVNFIPVAASANVENNVRSAVTADTPNQQLYSPNFDPNDQTDILNWVTNEARYGAAAGYNTKTIELPSGEIVGTAQYRGYYTASTARVDLGMQYELNDWCTFGLAMENINGATLDMKGNGIASYISYRELNTSEAQDLLDPGSAGSWAPFTNTWTTTFELGSTAMYLEPEKIYPLPKRLRYGVALKRPFLIAIDFENNQVPIKYAANSNGTAQEVTISDLNYLRLGMETRVFVLPWWLRSGITLMSKPTVTGLTASSQSNLDKAFKFGYFPTNFNLGSYFNSWGTLWGFSLGINPGSLINLAQIDITNVDLTRTVFYNIFAQRDAWQVSFISQVDPLATAAAYQNKTVPAGQNKNFQTSDLKFVQTLGVTYQF